MSKQQYLVRFLPGRGLQQFLDHLNPGVYPELKALSFEYDQIRESVYLFTFTDYCSTQQSQQYLYRYLNHLLELYCIVFFSCDSSKLIYPHQILLYIQLHTVGVNMAPENLTPKICTLINTLTACTFQTNLLIQLLPSDLPFLAVSFQSNEIDSVFARELIRDVESLLRTEGSSELFFFSIW